MLIFKVNGILIIITYVHVLLIIDGDVPWAMLTLRTQSRKHLLEKQRLNISTTLTFLIIFMLF